MPSFSSLRSPFRLAALVVLPIVIVSGIVLSTRVRWVNEPTSTAAGARVGQLPAVILWAWERPERLDFVDPSKAAVAFLSRTVYLRSNRVVVRPRLQPLAVREGAPVIAVVRIESNRHEVPSLNNTQLSETVDSIATVAALPGVISVQVDFDATRSERAFYRKLLFQLREKLPHSTGLTITALASWCQGDNWLEDLPIDEAVPMLFRMGVDRQQILSQLTAKKSFNSTKCRHSLGISTDESIDSPRQAERVYVFHPTAWSPTAVENALRIIDHEE